MRMVLTFTMFVIAVIAMFLFIETIRMQFQTKKQVYGVFVYQTALDGGLSI